jgi:hypothetical protein
MSKSWEADVVVVGGGVAGITAAIAAARSGAETVLVERSGWLGGIGITGATGLHSFYNVYGAEKDAPRRRLVGGVPQNLVDRVRELGGAVGHVAMERGADFVSMITVVEPETFKLAAAQLCRESGVKLLLHTTMVVAQASGGHVQAARIWSKAGFGELRGRVFIDCSGDADLAAVCGAEHVRYGAGDEGAYAVGFTFRLCNVDLAALEAHADREGLLVQLAHAVKPGMSGPSPIRIGITMRPLREQGIADAPGYFLATSMRPREITYCNCVNYAPADVLDPEDLTDAEVDLRTKMFQVAAFFRRHFQGCRHCYPAGAAPAAGPRRARAIRCDYELTESDVTSGRRFDDEVGLFGFIDRHGALVKDAGAYGIPYRALRPRGFSNLLIAGKMMSVERVAHNSTRNTTCCMVCGQAAGTAAALAAQNGCAVGELEAGELRDRLREAGAILDPVEE